MPTPRYNGGAELVPINLVAPAFGGINTEEEGSILDPKWATTLDNAVFDNAGRPSLRLGWNNITDTPGAGVVRRIFEYWQADGTSEVIFSTNSNIYRNTTTPTAIEGTLTITDGNIKFANFYDQCIAFGIGTGGIPAVYTGTTFADITVNSGTAPTGGIGTAAYGRLWCFDANSSTLRYSALLDATRWAVADGGGIIDFSSVWPAGQDSAVAIAEFGGDLVVWGRNNTVVLSDGQASTLGIDPLSLYVSDTLPGVGARSQFAMTRTNGDLWFLSNAGILGLKRELVQRSTPISNISRNVQSLLRTWTSTEADFDNITMEYDYERDFVVCVFPAVQRQIVFDTGPKSFIPGQEQYPGHRATTWSAPLQTVGYIRNSRSLLSTFSTGANGSVMSYEGFADNGSSFSFHYESGWLDLGQQAAQYLKFVKYLSSVVFVNQNVSVVHTVGYDFGLREYSIAKVASGSAISEFNIAEYGTNGSRDPSNTDLVAGTDVSEFSGSVTLRTMKAATQGSGQYIKVGLSVDTNSGEFAVQQLNLFAKIGRMAV